MSRVDIFILEFMYACKSGDALLSPKVIATNINYQRSYVNKRLRNTLVPATLVSDEGNGLYKLTSKGKLVAEGDLEPSDVEPLLDSE